MKIVNIKKFIRSLVIILGIIILMSLIISKSTFSHKEIEYKTICIEKGDTLWKIATNLQATNSYYSTKDVREIIDNIMNINSLQNTSLQENQKLKIVEV